MKPPIDRVRVSQRSRDILVTLKRRTGIEHWNVLCRWALMESMANPNKPVAVPTAQDSNVEMTWDVFSGDLGGEIVAALCVRAAADLIPEERLTTYFRQHLERGILQLQSAKNLGDLVRRVL